MNTNECIVDFFKKEIDHMIFYYDEEWDCECGKTKFTEGGKTKFTEEEKKQFESKEKSLRTKVEFHVMIELSLNYSDGEILVDNITKCCLKNNNPSVEYIKSLFFIK